MEDKTPSENGGDSRPSQNHSDTTSSSVPNQTVVMGFSRLPSENRASRVAERCTNEKQCIDVYNHRHPLSSPRTSTTQAAERNRNTPLPAVYIDSSEGDIEEALEAFKHLDVSREPIQNEGEHMKECQYYWLLYALYALVNHRLEEIVNQGLVLEKRYKNESAGSTSRDSIAREVRDLFYSSAKKRKLYCLCLPVLHQEVKIAKERLREWTTNSEDTESTVKTLNAENAESAGNLENTENTGIIADSS